MENHEERKQKQMMRWDALFAAQNDFRNVEHPSEEMILKRAKTYLEFLLGGDIDL